MLRLFNFGKWVMVSYVLNPVVAYADRLYLGTIGMASVALYTGPTQIVERLLILPTTLSATLFPAISALDGEGRRDAVRTITARAVKALAAVLGTIVVVMIATAREIVWVMLGEEFLATSVVVFQILSVGLLLNGVALIPHAALQACGRPDVTAKLHAAEAPVHLVVMILLATVWGVTGVAVAWVIRVGTDCLLLLFFAWRLGAVCPRTMLRGRLGRVGVVLVVAAFGAVGLASGPLAPAVRVGFALMLGFFSLLFIWVTATSPIERADLAQLIAVWRLGRHRPQVDRD